MSQPLQAKWSKSTLKAIPFPHSPLWPEVQCLSCHPTSPWQISYEILSSLFSSTDLGGKEHFKLSTARDFYLQQSFCDSTQSPTVNHQKKETGRLSSLEEREKPGPSAMQEASVFSKTLLPTYVVS